MIHRVVTTESRFIPMAGIKEKTLGLLNVEINSRDCGVKTQTCEEGGSLTVISSLGTREKAPMERVRPEDYNVNE